MKIRVNEAKSSFKTMKVGPVDVTVEDPFKSYNNQAHVFIKLEVPLTDDRGEKWDRDTSIGKFELEGNRFEGILKSQYRQIIGTALFNANVVEILKDKYDFGAFAKWEEDMLADKAGIDALKNEVKQRLESFKAEG